MMRRLLAVILATAACLALAASAQADFGIRTFEVDFTDKGGQAPEAGTHPFAVRTGFGTEFDEATVLPEGWIRNFLARQPAGFVGDLTAYERCTSAEFLTPINPGESGNPSCSLETQVGAAGVSIENGGKVGWFSIPVFNLEPPPGVLLRLAFAIKTQTTYIDIRLSQSAPYNAIAATRNAPQIFPVFGAVVELWGDPSDPAHDPFRGSCLREEPTVPPAPGDIAAFQFESKSDTCEVSDNPKPFLTMPTNCSQSLTTSYEAVSWNDLDEDGVPDSDSGSVQSPAPKGCEKLQLKPTIAAQPTNRAASSPTGLDFDLSVDDEGLTSVSGQAQSAIRKTVVTLPKGMTINPSQAEGLEVCSEAQLAAEGLGTQGCPEASKVGTVTVTSPLTSEALQGALYVAEPHHNLADDTLIAVYLVVKNTNLGVVVKQAIKVEPDPRTGQLIGTADDIPQLPFSSFHLHFREGGRSPLVTPPGCGPFAVTAKLYPWSGNPPVNAPPAEFEVISGHDESSCPPAGPAPFKPGFSAGTLNNSAAKYSPFYMRITRGDGEQDLSRLSATLPPGVLGRLAGVGRCSDAQIATAKAKSGLDERANPSCPLGSLIGHTSAGAGVGSQLTYVPGRLYLAGPYHGDPLSIASITPAVAGPFDVGTVVVREALDVNPKTGEVQADGSASDPIPHLLAGIPLLVRELEIYADRPDFVINPTDCAELQTKATLWGAGTALQPLAESPIGLTSPFQAVNCAKLGFEPRLNLRLKGGTLRGAHPQFRGLFRPKDKDANLEHLALRLPRSAFLDQAHIRTVCTRVQFAAAGGNGAGCPEGAIYGHARAFTPLLSEPLEGPVFLRSSNNKLPDLVVALHGIVDVEAVARIDSQRGGIRATFTDVPDAPISKVIVDMQGGKKGLVVNSTNLCRGKHRATADLDAHSGKQLTLKPLVQASCKKKRKARR